MERAWRSASRGNLEGELGSTSYQEHFEAMRQSVSQLGQCRTWQDITDHLRAHLGDEALWDDVTRVACTHYAAGKDNRWHTILLAIYWPKLEALFTKRFGWDRQSSDLWQNLAVAFLRTLSSVNLARRCDRLTQYICNRTSYLLYQQYHRVWDREAIEQTTETGDLPSGVIDETTTDDGEQDQILECRRMLETADLSPLDIHILIATRIYGHTLADVSKDIGLSVQAAKKRRQRAESRARKNLKNPHDECPLGPFGPPSRQMDGPCRPKED